MGGKKEAPKAPAKKVSPTKPKIMSLKSAKPKAKPAATKEDDDPMPQIYEEEEPEEPTKDEEPPKARYVNVQWGS